MQRLDQRVAKRPQAERTVLRALPPRKSAEFEEATRTREQVRGSDRARRAVQRPEPTDRPPADGAAVRRSHGRLARWPTCARARARKLSGWRAHRRAIDYRYAVAALKRNRVHSYAGCCATRCSRARCTAGRGSGSPRGFPSGKRARRSSGCSVWLPTDTRRKWPRNCSSWSNWTSCRTSQRSPRLPAPRAGELPVVDVQLPPLAH